MCNEGAGLTGRHRQAIYTERSRAGQSGQENSFELLIAVRCESLGALCIGDAVAAGSGCRTSGGFSVRDEQENTSLLLGCVQFVCICCCAEGRRDKA